MDYVKLGNSGLNVSPICLGCMSFGSAEGWVHNPRALDELEKPYVPHVVTGHN